MGTEKLYLGKNRGNYILKKKKNDFQHCGLSYQHSRIKTFVDETIMSRNEIKINSALGKRLVGYFLLLPLSQR